MIRLWWLIWYFTRPERPRAGNAPSWYKDEISRSDLVNYLSFNKYFIENWFSTLRRWYYTKFIGDWPSKSNKKEMARLHRQHKMINDLIDRALEKNYLVIARSNNANTRLETFLTIDYRGKNFKKLSYFFEAILSEFSHTTTLIVGLLGGGILSFIIQKLFNSQ